MKNNIINKEKRVHGGAKLHLYRWNRRFHHVEGEKPVQQATKGSLLGRFFSSKGQSILTKPIMIVLFIVAIIILINSMFSAMNEAHERGRESILRTAASNTMLLLSSDCLTYKGLNKEYTNVIDVSELDRFAQQYDDIEPACARSFDYGWRANVVEKDKDGINARTWSFGASDFSSERTLLQGIVINSPIGIRHSDTDIRPGVIELKFIEGELEILAGIIDKACFYNSTSASDVSLSINAKSDGNELCMGKNCRHLLCPADVNLGSGTYYISVNYRDGKISVIT